MISTTFKIARYVLAGLLASLTIMINVHASNSASVDVASINAVSVSVAQSEQTQMSAAGEATSFGGAVEESRAH